MELNSVTIRQTRIIPVDESWLNLIQFVRSDVAFGEMTILFKDGKPFQAVQVRKTIRF
jgi:hypothetical protein